MNLLLLVSLQAALLPAPKQTKTDTESAELLARASEAWVQVAADSDAKPVAACFIEHAPAQSPFQLTERAQSQIILRFFNLRDDPSAPAAIKNLTFLSVLLHDGELIWQGSVAPPRTLVDACQIADHLAEGLRQAVRKAKSLQQ